MRTTPAAALLLLSLTGLAVPAIGATPPPAAAPAAASASAAPATPAPTAATPAPAVGLLDGKSFHIEIADQATQSCSREHAVFLKGQFESMECRQYGFTRTAYQAQAAGDSTLFDAVALSPAEGTNTWRGVVKGKTVHGTLRWEKAGQKPVTYHFKGTALPLSEWPKELQKQVAEK